MYNINLHRVKLFGLSYVLNGVFYMEGMKKFHTTYGQLALFARRY
jgi:hypothetical protein